MTGSAETRRKRTLIKLFALDVDGTLTDGEYTWMEKAANSNALTSRTATE